MTLLIIVTAHNKDSDNLQNAYFLKALQILHIVAFKLKSNFIYFIMIALHLTFVSLSSSHNLQHPPPPQPLCTWNAFLCLLVSSILQKLHEWFIIAFILLWPVLIQCHAITHVSESFDWPCLTYSTSLLCEMWLICLLLQTNDGCFPLNRA